MKKRIKQFFSQFFSKMTKADISFVKKHLSLREQTLFFKLNIITQKHCVNVTYSLIKLYPFASSTLIKASLLHDIGKINSNLNVFTKSLCVLINYFFPKYASLISNKNKNHFLYFYFYHPRIGAKLLEKEGLEEEVIHIVKNHHSQTKDFNILLLQKADELN